MAESSRLVVAMFNSLCMVPTKSQLPRNQRPAEVLSGKQFEDRYMRAGLCLQGLGVVRCQGDCGVDSGVIQLLKQDVMLDSAERKQLTVCF
jgi:hypothetical protein